MDNIGTLFLFYQRWGHVEWKALQWSSLSRRKSENKQLRSVPTHTGIPDICYFVYTGKIFSAKTLQAAAVGSHTVHILYFRRLLFCLDLVFHLLEVKNLKCVTETELWATLLFWNLSRLPNKFLIVGRIKCETLNNDWRTRTQYQPQPNISKTFTVRHLTRTAN